MVLGMNQSLPPCPRPVNIGLIPFSYRLAPSSRAQVRVSSLPSGLRVYVTLVPSAYSFSVSHRLRSCPSAKWNVVTSASPGLAGQSAGPSRDRKCHLYVKRVPTPYLRPTDVECAESVQSVDALLLSLRLGALAFHPLLRQAACSCPLSAPRRSRSSRRPKRSPQRHQDTKHPIPLLRVSMPWWLRLFRRPPTSASSSPAPLLTSYSAVHGCTFLVTGSCSRCSSAPMGEFAGS